MIRSMTGYGSAEQETRAGRFRAEIKTVNHDTFRVSLRLPPPVEPFEHQIREWLRGHFPRGQVNFSLRLETPEGEVGAGTTLALDEVRARQYLRVLRAMKDTLGVPGEVDVALLSRFGDIIVRGEQSGPVIEAEDLRLVTEAAARAAVAMREDEGRRLHIDLEERLVALESAMTAVAERAPARLLAERDRLRSAVRELAADLAVDEERLAREIAFLAERWDIGEEVVRLASHIALFRETLDLDASDPVGKRLRFVSQEMHREVNTIGSKANDVSIQHRVVAMKNEIERLREQIENVE